MNRIHGPHRCDQCGRQSEFGWLYQCAQDVEHNLPISSDEHLFMALAPRDWDHKKEMSALGVSSSITTQYDAGLYTPEQIQKIKDQKRHLHNILVHEINNENMSLYPQKGPQRSPNSPVRYSNNVPQHATLASGADQHPYFRLPAPTMRRFRPPSSAFPVICRFRCCHRCRPFYQDRIYTSFETMLEDKNADMYGARDDQLHVIDAQVIKKISYTPLNSVPMVPSNTNIRDFAGKVSREPSSDLSHISLSPSGSSGSIAVFSDETMISPNTSVSTSPITSDTTSSLTSPRTTMSSVSLPITPASTRDWPDIPQERSPLSTYTAVPHNVGLPPPGLYRYTKKEQQSSGGAHRMILPIKGGKRIENSRASSNPLSSSNSDSSYGEEIDVDGGVALTEEAVELGVPDIITRPGTPVTGLTPYDSSQAVTQSIGNENLNAVFYPVSGHARTQTQT
ncbi:Hypothetical protein D9617_14g077110 [Elsinoe fawcettii]|nr:Hypothetical protein D9617_14g077110 [Elsinoe fawcettii]